MTEKDFISEYNYILSEKGEVSAKCNSNIALIKYWGKYENQMPANPSISYTLTNSFTKTLVSFERSNNLEVEVFLGNDKQDKFAEKIKNYFISLQKYLPFINQYRYSIKTQNSFPHSSGIASSASGFGAIAKCLMEMCELFGEQLSEKDKLRKASFLARLGSGSACRSLYNGLVVWGEHKGFPDSSNLYGIPYPFEIHPVFKEMQDTILLIHEGEKEISSTVGHKLMDNHPYAENRFKEAQKNLSLLINIIKEGDIQSFGKLIEHEALTLHAMMMTSSPSFLLMKPMTIAVIDKIWKFRELNKANLYFTLDAGANIHLLYPEIERDFILTFIKNDLLKYTENGKLILDKTAVFF